MHLDWEQLISTYGYGAILVGTFLEGESILVMGGLAAHQGYLNIWLVMAAAFAGSFCGDQLFFVIGRAQGKKLLARRPKWAARVARVHVFMQRFNTAFIVGFRFLYGLRSVSPFVLGTSEVSHRRFFILNMCGAILWSISVGSVGYLFGEVFDSYIDRIKPYRAPLFFGAFALACGMAALYRITKKRPDI